MTAVLRQDGPLELCDHQLTSERNQTVAIQRTSWVMWADSRLTIILDNLWGDRLWETVRRSRSPLPLSICEQLWVFEFGLHATQQGNTRCPGTTDIWQRGDRRGTQSGKVHEDGWQVNITKNRNPSPQCCPLMPPRKRVKWWWRTGLSYIQTDNVFCGCNSISTKIQLVHNMSENNSLKCLSNSVWIIQRTSELAYICFFELKQ